MRGEKVHIRFLTLKDAQAKLQMELDNKEFFKEFSVNTGEDFYTLLMQKEVIEQSTENREAGREYNFAIVENDTSQLVGTINLFRIFRGPLQSSMIGYVVDKKFNGRGYATEAIRLAVDYAFQELGLHRVEAGVMPHNAPSIRALEKAGFEREGLARKNVQINGRWQDHVVMAIINPEDE
ncbi:GNAT family protein [Planomicrobium sp. Y74]|uniref:GNAT family N-acetyltransferase n=1 Tax=Planomicrobium sp. Y74 TaxID=2478977 RepID=UPI000EF4BD25|nr:GNAT family protein [Planomicrobium sp. Y74]RLQ89785.1 N-acetyltransferase [Planomicrobium sp. Y74]